MEDSNRKRGKSVKEDAKEKMALIEAALYVAGRPLDLKTLGRIIGSRSKRKTLEMARKLMEEYKRRDSSLEILELEDQRFVLQLKSDYASKVRRLAVKPLLTDGPLRTCLLYTSPSPRDRG